MKIPVRAAFRTCFGFAGNVQIEVKINEGPDQFLNRYIKIILNEEQVAFINKVMNEELTRAKESGKRAEEVNSRNQ